MSESQKATRAKITIGSIEVDGFMLPDGSYRMSQTQTAECIVDDPVYARNFLKSKTIQALRGEGYTPETFEVDSTGQVRGETRIQGWTLDIVYAYWLYRCSKGNKQAFSLMMALGVESLERRFDAAFGVTRTEQERDDRLSQRLQELEQDLKGAMDFEAAAQYELNYVRDWLKQKGLDPWELPGDDAGSIAPQ